MTLVLGSIQLGLVYGLLALGVYVTFRILNTADLTVEGSFTLGMAVCATQTIAGRPGLALVLAVAAGALAGMVTGFLQTKAGVPAILSGILTMSGLYSVNLFVMGSASNLSTIGHDTLIEGLGRLLPAGWDRNVAKTAVPLATCLGACALLIWFFHTYLGLSIRATGNNEDMVRSSSIHVEAVKIIALAVANGCVALSGAVLTQYQGFADIGSGVGMVVVGLASVIIGERIFGRRGVTAGLLSAAAGSLGYQFVIALALQFNIFPAYTFKLLSALIVACTLAVPNLKAWVEFERKKRGGEGAC